MSSERVLVGMSGGIDSSIAAILLKDQGYEVIGITMKTWGFETSASLKKETGCCSLEAFNDARTIAVAEGFPHYILDMQEVFEKIVISNFISEYLAGRTPNPCILCNTYMKWDALLKKADQLKCKYIATGHYAKIRQENNQFILSRGKDLAKDQSYVLWGLTQEKLARTLFPLGDFSKEEIKAMAVARGLKYLTQKSESYEICFVPDNNYRNFLKSRMSDVEELSKPGEFILADGTIIGVHKGIANYTIGQRKGLEIAVGHPLYVVSIDPEKNCIVLGQKEDLLVNVISVHQYNLVNDTAIDPEMEVNTQIRYNGRPSRSKLKLIDSTISVEFLENTYASTPGQSAVFYHGDDVIGGGIIL